MRVSRYLISIFMVVCLCLPIWAEAALTSTVIWEVRSTGSDTNGGGFASTGTTDYSQQDAAQVSSATGANTALSVNFTDASAPFTLQMVGNIINIISIGAGTCTTGRYQMVGFNSTSSITLDRSPCSVNGSSITYKLGGGLATIQAGLSAITIAEQQVYIKGGVNYTITSGLTLPAIAAVNYHTRVIGYTTTHGDGGQATIITSTNNLTLLTMDQQGMWFEGLIFNCNNTTTSTGINATGGYSHFFNIKIANCTKEAILLSAQYQVFDFSEVTNCAGTNGSVDPSAGSSTMISRSWIHDNTKSGIYSNAVQNVIVNNLITKNTGHGINTQYGAMIVGNVIDGNTQSGIFLNTQLAIGLIIYNNILSNNGNYGIGGAGTFGLTSNKIMTVDYNGYYNNTSGLRQFLVAGVHDVSVTAGTPYTNSVGNDYSLNTTTNQGALLQSVGFPGVMPGVATIGYQDIGLYRHQDPAGGGSTGYVIEGN